jgi:hypothetical protein
VSSAGGAQFRVALRMYTTPSCHLEMTVWDKHLGHPFHPQLQRQPAVDLLVTHGHRLLGNYRSTRAPPLRHLEDQREARVLLGPHPTAS